MSSRLGQHLLRAKAKAENYWLFALYPCYFFYLLFGYPMVNFCLLLRKQSHSPNINHCIWDISFWPTAEWGVGFLHLTEFPVGFDHNARIPQITENTLAILKFSLSKMWKCPRYPK